MLMMLTLSVAATKGVGRGARRFAVPAKQSLGQNFLADDAVARALVAALPPAPDQHLVELGPGTGALTKHLLPLHPEMLAVELDQRAEAVLRAELPSLNLRRDDMLQLDFASLAALKGGPLSLISNTPFYLTSPLLFKILGSLDSVSSVVLTVQSEVADRILSPPSTKEYGILSVMLQLFGGVERLFEISPEAFEPQPKCSASALRLTPCATPAGSDATSAAQRKQLLAVLKKAFEQRRKMLRVTLKPLLGAASMRPSDATLAKRPEQLAPGEWVELSAMLFGDQVGGDVLLTAAHPSAAWQPHKAGYRL